jgi:hypothetical protein
MCCVLDFVKIRRSVREFRDGGRWTGGQAGVYYGYLAVDQKWFAISVLLVLYDESETKMWSLSPSGALNQGRTW